MGSKRRNEGGATFSGPSAAASALSVLGSRSGQFPVFSRSIRFARAVTVSAGVNVQCPAR